MVDGSHVAAYRSLGRCHVGSCLHVASLINGRIADVLKTHRCNSGQDMEQTLMRYVALYNHQLPSQRLKAKRRCRR